ncbi:MAG: hypothetical protein RL264_1996 [Bacteroidota bacterium]
MKGVKIIKLIFLLCQIILSQTSVEKVLLSLSFKSNFMKPQLFTILFFLGFTTFSFSQHKNCGTDEMYQQLYQSRPDLLPGIQRAENQLRAATKDYEKNQTKDDQVYIIPIVFHIIHNYGKENISDAQVLDGLKQLNTQLRKRNADTTAIVNVFKPLAADMQVEFRLAQLDPEGNCTSGITRTASPLTHTGDHQVKSLIHWPPNKYLNVYICAQAAGLAGHALLPSAADTIPEWDGIVISHDYVGTIGTSDPFRRTVLTHEVGHYLNLQHIWGGNNVPNYYYLPVGNAGNCAYDDEVDDTPLTIGWSSCNLNATSCGSLDMVQNYMDYSYCSLLFTQGQKTRAHACLNSSIANRNNLWTPANLIATGTDGNDRLCKAQFEASKRIFCVGEKIQLSDLSLHKVSSRTWTISGASNFNASDSTIQISFSNPGTYSVQLKVILNGNELTINEPNYLTVLPSSGSANFLTEDCENPISVVDQIKIMSNDSPNNWERSNLAGFNSESSLTVQNFNVGAFNTYEFLLKPIDASGINSLALSFDYAYAQKQNTDIEQLKVLYSIDCGNTWTLRRTYSGASTLKTVDGLVLDNFVPTSTQWKSDLLGSFNSAASIDKLLIKFVFESKIGNNIYIDNIRIADASVIGTTELLFEKINLEPNPSSSEVRINFDSILAPTCFITNLNGQEISIEKTQSENSILLHSENLSAGIYLVHLQSGNEKKTLRFVKL